MRREKNEVKTSSRKVFNLEEAHNFRHHGRERAYGIEAGSVLDDDDVLALFLAHLHGGGYNKIKIMFSLKIRARSKSEPDASFEDPLCVITSRSIIFSTGEK